jgi:myosin heavy subunit
MKVIGLDSATQMQIFQVLAAILWTGNVEFIDTGNGSAIKSQDGTN